MQRDGGCVLSTTTPREILARNEERYRRASEEILILLATRTDLDALAASLADSLSIISDALLNLRADVIELVEEHCDPPKARVTQ